jgi:secreted trypsin-like serine protease
MKILFSIFLSILLLSDGTAAKKNKAAVSGLAYTNDGTTSSSKNNDRMLRKRIIGGSTAASGEYPSYVYLNGYGGGTLIHGDAILTSASMKGYFIGQNVSIGGIYENGSDAIETISVRKEVSNIGYKFPLNNIMIVFLNQSSTAPIQKLNYATPIPMNSLVTTIGYGSLSNNTTDFQSPTLQKLLYNVKSCAAYDSNFFRPTRFICAGGSIQKNKTHATKGICIGDAGSPLLLGTEQIGVANFKQENYCGLTHDIPDGYTRVSFHRKWIQRTVCFNTFIQPLPGYCMCSLCSLTKDVFCRKKLCPKN